QGLQRDPGLRHGRAQGGPEGQRGGTRVVTHTFLFEEATWRVEGEHRDAVGAVSPVAGENSIRHQPGVWHFEAVLRLRGDPLRVPHNRYQIEPFSAGAASTHWSSNNPVLGALRGRFV